MTSKFWEPILIIADEFGASFDGSKFIVFSV